MYIKNYFEQKIRDIKELFLSDNLNLDFELIRYKKIDNCLVLWIKLQNSNYKLVIFAEKENYKIFVFDSSGNHNLYEIFSDSGQSSSTSKSQSIIKEGDYYYLLSPLSGKIEKVNVKDTYEEGEVIAIVSAMKMEHPLTADKKYKFVEALVQVGQFVDINQKIVKLQ